MTHRIREREKTEQHVALIPPVPACENARPARKGFGGSEGQKP